MNQPRWRRYLRFWKRDVAADVDDELSFHLAHRVEQYEASGMSHDDAVTAAGAQLGDADSVRTLLIGIDRRVAHTHDVTLWLDSLRSDLRTSIRSLVRQPTFSAAVVVTLALGLGVNAAMFSFLDRVFLRPPAGIVNPGKLRRFWSVEHDKKGEPVAAQLRVGVEEQRALTSSFGHDAAIAIYAQQALVRVGSGGDAPSATIVRAAANYLPLLGVHASVGRLFTSEETAIDSPARVAVISDALWRTRFGGDSSVIGKSIALSSEVFTIVGVTPPGFSGVDLERTDIWIPLGKSPIGMDGVVASRGRAQFAGLLARVSPRISDASLETRATTIIRRANAGKEDADSLERVVTGSIIEARGPGRPKNDVAIAERLGGVAIIVLLIACANVVNLLLARAAARRREIAVRVALGVSRMRLAWLLMVPTVILAFAAGIAAVASAIVTGAVLRSLLVPDVHFADSAIHWRVIVFTLLASLVVGTLSALVPSIQASRPDVTAFLKGATQSGTVQRSRLRSTLVAAQAALSVVLLVGAGLFLRSVHNVESIRLGFDVSRLAFAEARFDDWRAPDSALIARVVDRVRLVPGVEQVALVGEHPLDGGTWSTQFYTVNDSAHGDLFERPTVTPVSPNYFAATGLRIVRGKGFAADGSWSVVVNETMAREYWPTESAIGQCMRLLKPDGRCYTVVGIADDAHQDRVIENHKAHFYVTAAHPPSPGMRASEIVIRANPARWNTVVALTRRILAEAIPSAQPHVDRMEDLIAPAYRPFRLGAALFSVFGVLALLVSMVGVYSTVTYTVTQRMHEFGVRVALGAQLNDIARLVVGTGLKTVAVGTVLGVGLSLAAGRLIASFLYEVSPSDPPTLVLVVVLLLSVGAAAALAPAWRASRADPVSALRSE
jgi:predicted permease